MPAHHAIARLVARGYIRVIVTTNFDRLLEKAFEESGITATPIYTPEAAQGALPLAHSPCTIIKPNGDYLGTRIKNTPQELASYDAPMNRILDRVFDEYGLIVCGWSATWDIALKAAIERCPTHRFTTYWTCRHEPEGAAADLVRLRRATVVSVTEADAFFQELEAKVSALEQVPKPHPLSPKLAAALTKRHLSDPGAEIQLHDMVVQETERVSCSVRDSLDVAVPYSDEALVTHVERYEAITLPLIHVFVVGCYWGAEREIPVWTKCLERLANLRGPERFTTAWHQLTRYPALLALYAAGIASVAAEKYSTFKALVLATKVITDMDGTEQPVAMALTKNRVLDPDLARKLPGLDRHYTPLSDRLQHFLRGPFRQILPNDHRYIRFFDCFEYLLAVVYADLRTQQGLGFYPGDLGCFAWRLQTVRDFRQEQDEAGEEWPGLAAGLFDGSDKRFRAARMVVDTSALQTGWR